MPGLTGVKKPAAPAPVPTMPTPDDLEVQKAKKRSLAEQAARSGRASTILTDYAGGTDKLGG